MDDEETKERNKRIGRRLTMARKWRNLELADLAGKTNLSVTDLKNCEQGAGGITPGKLLDIAQLLDIPIDFFLADFFPCFRKKDERHE